MERDLWDMDVHREVVCGRSTTERWWYIPRITKQPLSLRGRTGIGGGTVHLSHIDERISPDLAGKEKDACSFQTLFKKRLWRDVTREAILEKSWGTRNWYQKEPRWMYKGKYFKDMLVRCGLHCREIKWLRKRGDNVYQIRKQVSAICLWPFSGKQVLSIVFGW